MKKQLMPYFIKIITLCGYFFLMCQSIVYAQAPDLKFEHFIDNKGLTQNSIMKMLQDNDGYLWIGTASGLYKYDGQRFTVYKHILNEPNSLVNNAVFELEMDAQGNILIGTGRGLSKFDKKTETFYTYPQILKDKRISAIQPMNDGSLWVGTLHSGLYYFKKEDKLGTNPEHYFYKPNNNLSIDSNHISCLKKDALENLWVGTSKGLNKVFKMDKTKGFIHFKSLNTAVKTLYLDKEGSLWIGFINTKLVRIKKPENFKKANKTNYREYLLKTQAPDGVDFGGIIAVSQGFDTNLWVGIHGNGLYWLNPETGDYKLYTPDAFNKESLSSINVETILIDKTNVLWVGTEVGGLNKCDLSKKDILFYTKNVFSNNSLSNASVNAITKGEENIIWVGTQDGLSKINFTKNNYKNPIFHNYYPSNRQLVNSEPLVHEPIRSILKDIDNDYWLSTTEGIVHMSYNSNTKKASFNKTDIGLLEVFSSLEDKKGYLWFGSFIEGLVKWKKTKKPNSNEFDFSNAVYYSTKDQNERGISGDEVSCIYEDSKGNIWIGTLQGGLNLYVAGEHGEKDTFVSYQHNPDNSNSLSHNSVFSIHEDKKGNYWIGTFGGGLNKMILPQTAGEKPIFEYFTEKDGLANDAVYGILEDDKGKLWLSTDLNHLKILIEKTGYKVIILERMLI